MQIEKPCEFLSIEIAKKIQHFDFHEAFKIGEAIGRLSILEELVMELQLKNKELAKRLKEYEK